MAQPVLLLTRAKAQSKSFAEDLEARIDGGFDLIISPVLRIEALPLRLDLARFDGLVFTSSNGVTAFAKASPVRSLPAWCVGDATARAAAAAGFTARSAAGNLGDLAECLRREAVKMDLLQVRGRHVAGDLSALIGKPGPKITEVVAYEQHAQPLNRAARGALRGSTAVLLPLFSPRSARLVRSDILDAHAPLHIAAMSPAVAKEVPVQICVKIATASSPDSESMLRTIAALLRRLESA